MDWTKQIEFYNDYPLLKRKAYELIAKKVNNEKGLEVLDFGCGDGKLLPLIEGDKIISLFDINPIALEKASLVNIPNNLKVFNSVDDLPKSKFNVAVCSLVLMCISNETELLSTIKYLNLVLKKSGKLIVLVTHPAFREHEFSYYKTHFNKEFDYFSEGLSFEVEFKNIDKGNIITDFHWSLSFTINTFLKNNFVLTEMHEMKDIIESNYSPYLLLEFKKN